MSSSASAQSASSASVPKPKSTALAINILDNDIARIYTHIHPVLVLSLYAFSFKAIVADAVPTLLNGVVPITALQVIYAIICLPPTSAGSRSSSPSEKTKGGKKKAAKDEGGVGAKLVPVILAVLLSTLLATPSLAFALILFGAPLVSHQQHTLLLASHLSTLATIPLIYTYGIDAGKWSEVAGLSLPVDEVFGAAVGAMMGAWVGAVPIPLDWDREWQKWPITVVTGAYIGWAVGKTLGGTVLKGRKIKFD